ncbi:MAG: hypothetical protein IH949_10525 [Bacteroidetes bacterium]|nr:hypothetical protein [Bacteroidota bacterium]
MSFDKIDSIFNSTTPVVSPIIYILSSKYKLIAFLYALTSTATYSGLLFHPSILNELIPDSISISTYSINLLQSK